MKKLMYLSLFIALFTAVLSCTPSAEQKLEQFKGECFDCEGRTNANVFIVDTVFKFDSAGNQITVLKQIGPNGDIVRLLNTDHEIGDVLVLGFKYEEPEIEETNEESSVLDEFSWEK